MEQVNALAAFREGYGLVDDLRASRAQRMAGQSLATGDYGGAANALYSAGQIAPGAQVQQMGEQRQAAEANALAGQQKQQQADFKDAGDFLLRGTQALLQNYQTPEQAYAQYQANIRPVLLQMQNPEMMKLVQQIDAQGVNGFSKEGLQQFATLFGGKLQEREYMVANFGDAGYIVDKQTGQERQFYKADPKPLILGEGQVAIDRGAGQMQFSEGQARSAVQSIVPGAQVTSGARTPEKNAAVGGVANSFHLKGEAVDFVLPPGQTFEQVRARFQAQGLPMTEFINEGDHIHWAWGGKSQPREIARGPQKQQWRVASPQELAAVGLPADAKYQIGPSGQLQPLNTGEPNQKDQRKGSADLRKEFNQLPEVKDFNNVAASYDVIRNNANGAPSAAGDISLIFAYMKMLDPGSVVREGEFANAQNTGGIPDQVRNAYNKAVNGQRLNPSQRQEFVRQAGIVYDSRRKRYDDLVSQYQGYASDYGLPADVIVPRAGGQSAPAPKAPVGKPGGPPNPRVAPKLANSGRPLSPQEAAKLPKGTRFKGTDGKVYTRQ